MKEILENKIEEQIKLILNKEVLTIEEISLLNTQLIKIEAKEDKEELNKKNKEMTEHIIKVMNNI